MTRVEWMTFSRLRGDAEPREWMRWSELWAWAREQIPSIGIHGIRQALRSASRPQRRYGHYRYTSEHMAAIRAYAERAGLLKEGVTNG